MAACCCGKCLSRAASSSGSLRTSSTPVRRIRSTIRWRTCCAPCWCCMARAGATRTTPMRYASIPRCDWQFPKRPAPRRWTRGTICHRSRRCRACSRCSANLRVLQNAVAEMAGRRLRAMRRGHRLRQVTIDIDGLPIEVHGNQPKAAYNGHYHQQMYHPIVASSAETGDMLDARLRAGDAHTAEGALDFVLDLVSRVEMTLCQVALVRMGAGFPGEPLLAGLEANRTPYVARIKTNNALDRLAAAHLARSAGRAPARSEERR